MATFELIKKIFDSKFGGKHELKPNDNLYEIGIDSLDLVELMIEIENTAQVEFTTEEIADLKLISDVVTLINSKINK